MSLDKSKYSKLLLLLTGLSSSGAFSAGHGNNNDASNLSSFVATLSGGAVWEKGGKTQTLYLAPETEKTYTANKPTHALAEGEVFIGIQRILLAKLPSQFGISVVTTENARFSGDIWDDADPQFNNYTYSYQLRHTHIALKGKLLIDRGYFIMPWISGSIGVGFNQAHRFNNIPTISEAVENPNFSSNTTTAFTYTVGAGIQKDLTKNWQIGMGYEFADWGKNQLGRAFSQTLGRGVALNHLYTNGFLLNITYLS